jgi:hypothetical protein
MVNELTALSTELADVVGKVGKSVVAVDGRPRFGSSGVFWRPGIIVTAEHTIRREDEIEIALPDGAKTSATVAGSDPGTDLAVLKVDGHAGDAPTVAAGDPVPGNLALSIGRSPDSGVNATMGIVSAVSGSWRTWRGGRLDRYIRLDLTMYPASSGGLVVNTKGEAIGIATSALSRIAGLAIPASTVESRGGRDSLARACGARLPGRGVATGGTAGSSQRSDRVVARTGGPGGESGGADRRRPGFARRDGGDRYGRYPERAGRPRRRPEDRGGVVRGGAAVTVGIVVGERSRRN